MKSRTFLTLIVTSIVATGSGAQILIEDPYRPRRMAESKPEVGEKAARKYFEERESSKSERSPSNEGSRYLALHFGPFLNDKQYRWGDKDRSEDVGQLIFGVDYRMGQWTSSMDLLLRADLISFDIDEENPLKLSLMPVVTFPDVEGNFPLYFGAGAGVGVFFRQLDDESELSFDYALLTGVRFPELFESGGLIFEAGYRGQVFLLSSGQHTGVYVTVGGVFNF